MLSAIPAAGNVVATSEVASPSGRMSASSAKPKVTSAAPCARRLVRQPAPVRVADVHRCRRCIRPDEEAAFRLEVVLHRPVEVEVVLAQVREDERREADAVEAPQRRAVRRRLHRAAPVAGVEHLPEETLEVDRLGGRPRRRPPLAVDAGLDRPEQTGPPAGGGEHRVEQERRRGLPVRPGDADDGELSRSARRRTHRRQPPSQRARRARRPAARRGRAAARRRAPTAPFATASGREVVTVDALPGDAEEERAGLDHPGVVGQVAHLALDAPDDVRRRERGDQPCEVHDGRV